MSKWLYNSKIIDTLEDLPNDSYGFIYITTHIPSGKKYLGKKSLFSTLNKKLGKKELANLPITRGRTKTTKKVIKESDWKTYYGSEDFIKNKIKEKLHHDFHREIIHIVKNKKHLTYFECKYQFQLNVIESHEWLNSNILGKFFKSDFDIEN